MDPDRLALSIDLVLADIGVGYNNSKTAFVYRIGAEEFCRITGLRKRDDPGRCYIQWKGEDERKLDACLRFWSPDRYDRTCFHPEFPHLINGR